MDSELLDNEEWKLAKWLSTEAVACTFSLQKISEHTFLDKKVIRRALRRWLRYCYADNNYVQSRLNSGAYGSGEELFQKEKFPDSGKDKVRKGDFGEAIGHYLLERHPSLGFRVPVLKLRYKEDPDSAPHGFDLLGFQFQELDSADVLCIGEVRLRTAKTTWTPNTIAEGHKTLAKYDRRREIKQIGKIAWTSHTEGDAETCNRLARFGDGWAAASFTRVHVFIALLDAKLDIDDMIQVVDGDPQLIPTFRCIAVLVQDLPWWVQEAFAP